MRIRTMMAMALVGAALALAAPALAVETAPTSGDGEIGVKDVRGKTVSIGDYVYRVTPMTVIRDLDGNRIKLRHLPVPDAGAEAGEGMVVAGEFEAVEVRGQMVLQSLTLVDAPQ